VSLRALKWRPSTLIDGICLHPVCVFFGGMAEASMKEDEQGTHVEFLGGAC